MYYIYYEPLNIETEPVATLEEAEKLINEVGIEITATYGYCDPEELYIAEYKE